MTKFAQKSFSVAASGTKAYRDNWEATFGKKSDVASPEIYSRPECLFRYCASPDLCKRHGCLAIDPKEPTT